MQFHRIAQCATLSWLLAAAAATAQDATSFRNSPETNAPASASGTADGAAVVRRTPDGLWMSAGVGGGWTRITCAICRTDRNLGPSGYVRVGTTLRPGLLLAVEADGWTREDNNVRSNALVGGIATHLYPDPDGGLFLRTGLSYVRYSVDGGSVGTGLFGLLVGAGYEFTVAPGINVTNYVSLVASSFGSLRGERGTAANDVSLTLLQFGIGLTRH